MASPAHHEPFPSPPLRSPFRASDHAADNKAHLLLAASGSVATIKIVQILQSLSKHDNLSIRLLLTPSAAQFLQAQSAEQPALASLLDIPNVDGLHLDVDEWTPSWVRGAPILHIELRRWSDLLVISPLSANMLAKIVGGFSDGLLASVVRAWDTTGLIDGIKPGIQGTAAGGKRIVVAPAMNTGMWRQPITGRHIRTLEEDWGVGDSADGWFEVLRPKEKALACGDVGDGAMREWQEIVEVIEERLGLHRDNR